MKGIVENGWNSHNDHDIESKITGCTRDLEAWGNSIRPKFREEIKCCEEELEVLRTQHDDNAVARFCALKNHLSKPLIQKETYWRQWEKTHWLKGGDCNTKFFHASATMRKKGNMIVKLVNESGVVES